MKNKNSLIKLLLIFSAVFIDDLKPAARHFKPDVNYSMNSQNVDFWFHVYHGNYEDVKSLLADGVYVDTEMINDTSHETPLLYAIKKGRIEMVELLLKYHANVNFKNQVKETPLIFACTKTSNNCVIAKLLLGYGANVNFRSYYEKTPLMFCEDVELAKLLIEHGANIDAQDRFGYTALIIAARNRNYEMVKLLLEHNADIYIVSKYGGETFLSLVEKDPELKKIFAERQEKIKAFQEGIKKEAKETGLLPDVLANIVASYIEEIPKPTSTN